MITLDVTTDDKSGIAGMLSGLRSQLPFALSVAINDTVNQVQTAIQNSLAADFTLRRPDFIANTIYRKPGQDFATRDKLIGAVRVNPDPKRNELAKFEDGGTKRSTTGKSVAVPIVRQKEPMLVVRGGDPISLKNVFLAIHKRDGQLKHGRRRKGESRAPIDPHKIFLVGNDKGTFILQRLGPGLRNNRVIWWFRPTVPIPASLHFDDTAMRVALERWEPNYQRALELAIATMR